MMSRNAKQFSAKAALIASIGGLLFGYDIGVVEGALPQLANEMHLSLGQQDTVVAIMVAGALFGALFAGYLTDRLGRWFTIVLTDITFIIGGAVLFAAQNPGKFGVYFQSSLFQRVGFWHRHELCGRRLIHWMESFARLASAETQLQNISTFQESLSPMKSFPVRLGVRWTLYRGNGRFGVCRSGRVLPCRGCPGKPSWWDGVLQRARHLLRHTCLVSGRTHPERRYR